MPRPSLSLLAVDSMRDRLADAALAIYRDDGLEAVSFRRLAEVAGISHTLPYRYFADKDALLARVRTLCFAEFEAHVRSKESAVGGMRAHLESIASAYVGYATAHADVYRLMFSIEQPAPDRHPELLAARRSLFEHAVDTVQRYIDRGELTGDARLLVHLLWVSLHGLMSLHVARQLVHGRTLDALVQPLIERLLRMPPSAGRASTRRTIAAKTTRRRHP